MGSRTVSYTHLDVYKRQLLYQVPVPATLGNFASPPSVNTAQMSNKGIDIQVINKGRIKGDLTYEVNVTAGIRCV